VGRHIKPTYDPLVLSDNRHPPRCTRSWTADYAILAALDKLATKRKVSEMRSAKNFHPERDYVPAKSFLVAMAIGAIASGQVVLSLVDVPIGPASVAARTLATPAQAPIGAPEPAQLHAQPVVEPTIESGADNRLGAAANESSTNLKVAELATIANPPTEARPNDALAKIATGPSAAAAPAENKTTKNRRAARHAEPRVARGGYGAWDWGGSASHLY
jgi:hypothetical protein